MSKKILIIIILALCFVSYAYAGPVSYKHISFVFKLNDTIDGTNLDGDWNMYFISVGEFDAQDNWTFANYENKIKQDYIYFKNNCGTKDTFHEIVYKMDEEERKHKGCVINGTYQEVYCFKTVTENNKCSSLIPYKINLIPSDNNLPYYDSDYKDELSFKSYYDSYMWDIGKAKEYKHYSVSYCHIKNNLCNITIDQKSSPYNPFIIVLEKSNSNKEVYFSDKINIAAMKLFYNESLFSCIGQYEPACKVDFDVKLKLDKFEIKEPNLLVIEFGNDSSFTEQSKDNTSKAPENWIGRLIMWLKGLFLRR